MRKGLAILDLDGLRDESLDSTYSSFYGSSYFGFCGLIPYEDLSSNDVGFAPIIRKKTQPQQLFQFSLDSCFYPCFISPLK